MPTHLLIQGSGYSRSGGIYDWNGILPTDKLFQSDEDSLITSLSPWQQSNQVYSDFLSELTGIKSSLTAWWFVSAWLGYLEYFAKLQRPSHLCYHARPVRSQLESFHRSVYPSLCQSVSLPDYCLPSSGRTNHTPLSFLVDR